MLARVGLSDSAGMQLRKFSKGMLQRVGLAQAILHDPKLVFLDEPMSGLDPMGRREVRDLIQQLRHEGKTVFFSTHILSDAEALCDRVGVIYQGELRGVGAVAELTSQTQSKVEIIFCAQQVPVGLTSLGAERASQRRHGKRGIAGRTAGCGTGVAAARAHQIDFADAGAQFARRILHPEIAAPDVRKEENRQRSGAGV